MPEFFLIDCEVPMQPLCSPEAPSSAPLPPPFVLSWDPGDVAQLPCSALIEVVLQKRSDIASLCRMHQDTKDCEIDNELTEQNRFVEFAWELVTEAHTQRQDVLEIALCQLVHTKRCFQRRCFPNNQARRTLYSRGSCRDVEVTPVLNCGLRWPPFGGCKGGPPATQGGLDPSNFTPQGTACLLVVRCLLLGNQ